MITKERLEELIKQGATIYTTYGGYISEINLHRKYDYSTDNHLFEADIVAGETGFRKYTFNILFETKEEAEWNLEFGNITRTEQLKLPTWEEFLKLDKIYSFRTKYGKVAVMFSDNNTLFVEDEEWNILRQPLTKENYTLACRKCKELFLGEDNEKI